jgi:DNA-binding transcriptional ArsR family regulator
MVTHPKSAALPISPDVYRAIADPTRRAILDRLRGGPVAVNALVADFSQSRPSISKHLRVLRSARLVGARRSGRQRCYYLEPAPLHNVAKWIEEYRVFWQTSVTSLKRRLQGESEVSEPDA